MYAPAIKHALKHTLTNAHRRNRHSFGANPYLIVTPGGLGNIMIDCPRFADGIHGAVASLSPHGVRYMVMTHTDDVAGHVEWSEGLTRSNAAVGAAAPERVIHAEEVRTGWNRADARTAEMEVHLGAAGPPRGGWAESSTGSWILPLGGDVSEFRCELILTPGHSRGSLCINMNNEALFTGDTLCVTNAFKKLGWTNKYTQDYPLQIASIRDIISRTPHDAILPGHGRPFFHRSQATRVNDIVEAARGMANGEFDVV